MLVSILPVPFADAARQRQYEAVLAALQAEAETAADAPATVLLGNLGAFLPIEADMLLVRPGGVALVVLMPHAGHLSIPVLTHGTWQLDGEPLLDVKGGATPFAQCQQQLPPTLAWLSEQVAVPEAELPPSTSIALFEAPLTFGPEVEAQLHRHSAAFDFQLVGGAEQLPARLRPPLQTEAGLLTEEALLDWGYFLADDFYAAHQQREPESPFTGLPAYLAQQLRQLWRWLGAEDIPADPPYGGGPPDQHLRDQQEQARLQQLRRELQAELHQQRQEAATREAARTQELALLRQQLAQAGPSPTEQQAKKALEESLRTARAELTTRNHELDARIQQLGQLIEQLRAAPAPPATAPPAVPAPAPKPRAATPAWSFRRLRQAERWGVVLLAVASVGAGTWGIVRWAYQPVPRTTATVAQRAQPDENFGESQPEDLNYPTDSLANAQAAAVDTAATQVLPGPAASEAAPTTEPTAQPVQLHVDSAAAGSTPAPPVQETDSAASPTP